MYVCPQEQYPLFLSGFNETWIFSMAFVQISILMKIRPVGAELFHADGRTGIQSWRSLVAFRSFANAPKTVDTAVNSS